MALQLDEANKVLKVWKCPKFQVTWKALKEKRRHGAFKSLRLHWSLLIAFFSALTFKWKGLERVRQNISADQSKQKEYSNKPLGLDSKAL